MQGLIKQLEQQKLAHKQSYDNLTAKDLFNKRKKTYVPRMRTREELLYDV